MTREKIARAISERMTGFAFDDLLNGQRKDLLEVADDIVACLPKPALTISEQAIIAEARTNAEVTGEGDDRSPSDLRRQQRRLIAIIDKLIGEP